MKRFLLFLLCLILPFILIGCSGETSTTETEETTADETEEVDPSTVATNTDSSILVAYFSATGNTRKVAEYISEDLSAKLYEITPQDPYTDEDLDYNNDSSRVAQENEDDSIHPPILADYDGMDTVNTIFLGYPIWYGKAPNVIDTFLESYEFNGKTIIPFCTSASSGIGSSATDLEPLAPNAEWEEGMRFPSDASKEEVTEWVDSLGLK